MTAHETHTGDSNAPELEVFDPIKYLESTPIELLMPSDVQAAINAIVPGSETALADSEVILGITSHATLLTPTEEWDEMTDRAMKINKREQNSSASELQDDTTGAFVFPEGPEGERSRVNKWLRDNHAALAARLVHDDTLGSHNGGVISG